MKKNSASLWNDTANIIFIDEETLTPEELAEIAKEDTYDGTTEE